MRQDRLKNVRGHRKDELFYVKIEFCGLSKRGKMERLFVTADACKAWSSLNMMGREVRKHSLLTSASFAN